MVPLKLARDETDDPEFVELVSEIISCVATSTLPSEIHVLKVDNWFGSRWLRFSHKVMGAFGLRSSDLVVPPFVPSRILEERAARHIEGGSYEEFTVEAPLHVWQSSAENSGRKLSRAYPQRSFFWWSSRTARNGRGCLMSYVLVDGAHDPWYVEFTREAAWRPVRFEGIDSRELAWYTSSSC